MKVPLSKPSIGEEEIKAVSEVLKSGNLSLGPKLPEFEEKFASYIGTKYAVAVSSGTSGLHLCMKLLNLKQGDEVITSPFSFIASANCILYEKAKPVFVDIKENDFNIDPDKIEEAITEKTKAILPVHIFGKSTDMDKIKKIAEKYNLAIIEDACEAVGAKYQGKKVGSLGNFSVFAFYPNKQITTGEGGIITLNDEEKANLLKSLRNQGRSTMSSAWLAHDVLGYNYRLSDISCAIGIEQLKKIDYILEKRKQKAKLYNELLSELDVICPEFNEEKSWFVYVIRVKNRDHVMKKLIEKGVACRPYLPAIHLQPIYKKLFNYKEGDFPVCEKVSNSTLALPFFTEIIEEEINYVYNTLKEILE